MSRLAVILAKFEQLEDRVLLLYASLPVVGSILFYLAFPGFFLGLLSGVLLVVGVQAAGLWYLWELIRNRKKHVDYPPEDEAEELHERAKERIHANIDKTGVLAEGSLWISKRPCEHIDETPGPKSKKGDPAKTFAPAFRYAVLEGPFLTLLGEDNAQETVHVEGCEVVAISETDDAHKKWARKFPLRIRHPSRILWNDTNEMFCYFVNGHQKELWSRALRRVILGADWGNESTKFDELQTEFTTYMATVQQLYGPHWLGEQPHVIFSSKSESEVQVEKSAKRVRRLKLVPKVASFDAVSHHFENHELIGIRRGVKSLLTRRKGSHGHSSIQDESAMVQSLSAGSGLSEMDDAKLDKSPSTTVAFSEPLAGSLIESADSVYHSSMYASKSMDAAPEDGRETRLSQPKVSAIAQNAEPAEEDEVLPTEASPFPEDTSLGASEDDGASFTPAISRSLNSGLRRLSARRFNDDPALLASSQDEQEASEQQQQQQQEIMDPGAQWLNLLVTRLFFDLHAMDTLNKKLQHAIDDKLRQTVLPSVLGPLSCSLFHLGDTPPLIRSMRAVLPIAWSNNLCLEADLEFRGRLTLVVQTCVKLKEAAASASASVPSSSASAASSQMPSSASETLSGTSGSASVSAEDLVVGLTEAEVEKALGLEAQSGAEAAVPGGNAASMIMGKVRGVLNSMSAAALPQLPLTLSIYISQIRGTARLEIAAPPSDRIWFSFVEMPEVRLEIHPSIGELKLKHYPMANVVVEKIKGVLKHTIVQPACIDFHLKFMTSDNSDWLPTVPSMVPWRPHLPEAAYSSSSSAASSHSAFLSASGRLASASFRMAESESMKSEDGGSAAEEASLSDDDARVKLLPPFASKLGNLNKGASPLNRVSAASVHVQGAMQGAVQGSATSARQLFSAAKNSLKQATSALKSSSGNLNVADGLGASFQIPPAAVNPDPHVLDSSSSDAKVFAPMSDASDLQEDDSLMREASFAFEPSSTAQEKKQSFRSFQEGASNSFSELKASGDFDSSGREGSKRFAIGGIIDGEGEKWGEKMAKAKDFVGKIGNKDARAQLESQARQLESQARNLVGNQAKKVFGMLKKDKGDGPF